MPRDKASNRSAIDPSRGYGSPFEPPREVLDDLRVGLDAGLGVAAGLQIESEPLNDYAEMAGGHPLADKAREK